MHTSPPSHHTCLEEQAQQKLYDAIASEYQIHATEPWSTAYREHFIYKNLLHGLDLKGKNVLDAMCGPVSITPELLKQGAKVTALDNSPECLKLYSKLYPECDIKCASILQTDFPDNMFDAIFIVAGLHHIHPYVTKGVNEITRILKPGGLFCFVEPHKGTFIDPLRKLWY